MRSIRTKLLAGITMLCLLLIGVVWCIYQYIFSRYVREEASKNIELLMHQTDKAVESSMSMIESSVEYFFMDKTLQEWINMGALSPNEELLGKLDMDEAIRHSLLANSAWENDLIEAAYFYVDQYAFTFYSNGSFPIYPLTQQVKRVTLLMQEHDGEELQLFLPTDGTNTFFIGKSYVDRERQDKTLNLVIAVDEENLMEEYAAINQYQGAQACLVDQEGNIYSSANKERIGGKLEGEWKRFFTDGRVEELTEGGKTYYVSGKEISKTGLWLLIKIPKESYAAAMTKFARQYVLILCMVFVAVLLVGMFAVYKGTSFLEDIEKRFVAVKNGDYSVTLPDFKSSELYELSRAFNGMIKQIDYLIHEVYEKEIAVKKAEVGFLQSQINPHFLFNAFATIGTKAKLVGQEEIYRMIRAISTLLEAGFRPGEKGTVEIRRELEYVECYLYIQKERFGERLQYEVKIEDEELLACQVPRLCLEPIVENAVIHGIEPKVGTGRVLIEISKEMENLCLAVTDDGVGFEEEDKPRGKGSSIGIQNTDKRLKLIYGERYGVFLDKGMEKGARVMIKIPCTGEEKHV